MTYCVALCLKGGLVMLADTRTNAGVDNIATFRKLAVIEKPGERVIGIMSAGNLAISQTALHIATETGSKLSNGETRTLETASSIAQVTQLLGEAVREVYRSDGPVLEAQTGEFKVSFLVGGQIGSGPMRLYQIYAAGNFIEATEDTPFFQIGEHKYGKPILDRAASYDTDVNDALKLALISMDSTIRSNLSVGLPVDLMVYRRDSLKVGMERRIYENDPYFSGLRKEWSDALSRAYRALPGPNWEF
jgi:putative proteasome-type protease